MRALRKDNGSIQRRIQSTRSGSTAATGERSDPTVIAGDRRIGGYVGAMDVRCAVQARGAGLDSGGAPGGGDLTTAAMDEAQRNAWCREQGIFPADLQQWRQDAVAGLSQPEEARASPQETREDRRRIKELERDLRRKEKALAETAALLVLSKKLEALFQEGGDE